MNPAIRALIVAPVALLLCGGILVASGHATPPEDARRTVVTMFLPGTVVLPPGEATGPVGLSTIPSPALEQFLASAGVTGVARAFPNFSLADTSAVGPTGQAIRIPDYTRIFTLVVPQGTDVNAFISDLSQLSGVCFAERAAVTKAASLPTYPNDPLFADGTQWGMWNYGQTGGYTGVAGEDVRAPWAWGEQPQGVSANVAILDGGFDNSVPDLAGRCSGDTGYGNMPFAECDDHGFMVAGVLGANANNGVGIAGVAWNVGLKSFRTDYLTSTGIAAKITSAYQDPTVKVLNASWTLSDMDGGKTDPLVVKMAIYDAYRHDVITAAAMGNTGSVETLYPASYFQGVIGVGATQRDGYIWNLSTGNDDLDVVAPGSEITSCTSTGGYQECSGTSFATPIVSGIAAVLRTKEPTLSADDVQHLIELSATPKGNPNERFRYGYGQVNYRRALEMLQPPNVWARGVATQLADAPAANSGGFTQFYGVAGLVDGQTYQYQRYDVHILASLPAGMFTDATNLNIWGRGGAFTNGYSAEAPNLGVGWCDLIPGTIDLVANTCKLRTFFYYIDTNGDGGFDTWFPFDPANPPPGTSIQCAWTALQVAPVPDFDNSYYVPQAGYKGAEVEGTNATKFFRACPNNDGGSALPTVQSPRVMVVLHDALDHPIVGAPAEYVLIPWNGGTAEQGFVGDGADSIVATHQWSHGGACPDAYGMIADGPTNIYGQTYITFGGAVPGSLGVATRDPLRKWGHYDSELPVYAFGVPLEGRITSGAINGTYTLQIKNMDFAYGLGTVEGQGETVGLSEFNAIANSIGQPWVPEYYWRDLDSSGEITQTDLNIITGHLTHDCSTPDSP